jgi:hypothetical protein
LIWLAIAVDGEYRCYVRYLTPLALIRLVPKSVDNYIHNPPREQLYSTIILSFVFLPFQIWLPRNIRYARMPAQILPHHNYLNAILSSHRHFSKRNRRLYLLRYHTHNNTNEDLQTMADGAIKTWLPVSMILSSAF